MAKISRIDPLVSICFVKVSFFRKTKNKAKGEITLTVKPFYLELTWDL